MKQKRNIITFSMSLTWNIGNPISYMAARSFFTFSEPIFEELPEPLYWKIRVSTSLVIIRHSEMKNWKNLPY